MQAYIAFMEESDLVRLEEDPYHCGKRYLEIVEYDRSLESSSRALGSEKAKYRPSQERDRG